MPRPHSWQVPSPGHRPAGRPDPVERLAVPVVAELDREGSREGQTLPQPTRPLKGKASQPRRLQ